VRSTECPGLKLLPNGQSRVEIEKKKEGSVFDVLTDGSRWVEPPVLVVDLRKDAIENLSPDGVLSAPLLMCVT